VSRDVDEWWTVPLVSDPETGRYNISYRPESLLLSIVTAVSAATGRDPVSLPPLAESIDTDAIESLFGPGSPDQHTTRLEFEFAGCLVTIRPDSTLRVVPNGSGSGQQRQ
jgi:hypothetical protein